MHRYSITLILLIGALLVSGQLLACDDEPEATIAYLIIDHQSTQVAPAQEVQGVVALHLVEKGPQITCGNDLVEVACCGGLCGVFCCGCSCSVHYSAIIELAKVDLAPASHAVYSALIVNPLDTHQKAILRPPIS